MTTFLEHFDATERAALETEDGKAFAAAGFNLYPNGGGCTAWRKVISEGRDILITDSEGCSHDLGESHILDASKPDCWLIGLHMEGEETSAEAATVAEAILAADKLALLVPPTIADKIKLARAFGSKMQEALSTREFRAMCDANKAEPENSGICHSHDYLDANMTMHEAFVETFGREPAFLNDSENTTDLELWNDAWAIAKAADFFA